MLIDYELIWTSAPHNKELAIGAVMPGGTYFKNEYFIELLNVSQNTSKIKYNFK